MPRSKPWWQSRCLMARIGYRQSSHLLKQAIISMPHMIHCRYFDANNNHILIRLIISVSRRFLARQISQSVNIATWYNFMRWNCRIDIYGRIVVWRGFTPHLRMFFIKIRAEAFTKAKLPMPRIWPRHRHFYSRRRIVLCDCLTHWRCLKVCYNARVCRPRHWALHAWAKYRNEKRPRSEVGKYRQQMVLRGAQIFYHGENMRWSLTTISPWRERPAMSICLAKYDEHIDIEATPHHVSTTVWRDAGELWAMRFSTKMKYQILMRH